MERCHRGDLEVNKVEQNRDFPSTLTMLLQVGNGLSDHQWDGILV